MQVPNNNYMGKKIRDLIFSLYNCIERNVLSAKYQGVLLPQLLLTHNHTYSVKIYNRQLCAARTQTTAYKFHF